MKNDLLITLLSKHKKELEAKLRKDSTFAEYQSVMQHLAQLEGKKQARVAKTSTAQHTLNLISVPQPSASAAKASRAFAKRDVQNGPAPSLKHGERIKFIYDATVDAIKRYGPASPERLEQILAKEFGLNWTGKNKDSSTRARITTYIYTFNRENPTKATLQMLPEKQPGYKRVGKYTQIKLAK